MRFDRRAHRAAAISLGLAFSLTPLALPAGAAVEGDAARYQYVSPLPGSRMVSPWNNVTLRLGEPLDRATLAAARLEVTGARSGRHDGALAISDDGLSLVFTPRAPFTLGERVGVRFGGGVRTAAGEALPALAFDFDVAAADPAATPRRALADLYPESFGAEDESAAPPVEEVAADIGCGLPAGYPTINVMTANAPEPGAVFIAPFSFPSGGRLMILDNLGQPLFYRRVPNRVFDFKRQPNGQLTGFAAGQFFVMDSAYAVVDSFAAGNGYLADAHELELLPNGHALLMAYDPQPVAMDELVEGGRPDATVVGLIIQEVDTDGNVVFQWRSWDHFQITDADTCLVNLRGAAVDYAHGNAIAVDLDGHLLISSRHMNEITKVHRGTGAIIWRLGQRAKHNMFAFTNDARPWTAQHDIRVLPSGRYTLFDNGNCQAPAYSRALEFKVNERSMKVNRMWEHRNAPDVYGPFMGNAQRLPSGATMIGWGGTPTDPKVTEVHANGDKSFELGFASSNTYTYRAFRFPWEWRRLEASASALAFGTVDAGVTATQPLEIRNISAEDFTVSCLFSTHPWFWVAEEMPLVVPAGGAVTVNVGFRPLATGDLAATLYARAARDTELVAQAIATLSGSGFGVTAADPAAAPGRFALHAARPSPFTDATAIRFDLGRPGWVSLEVFDLQGRKVDTLVDGFRPAGRHEVAWRGGTGLAGIYFYRLRSGNFSATERLVRVR